MSEQYLPNGTEGARPSSTPRPSLFAANALYLLAAAGLALMPVVAGPIAQMVLALLPGVSREGLLLIVTLCYCLPFTALPAIVYIHRRGIRAAVRLERPLSPGTALAAALAALLSVPLGACISLLWSVFLQAAGLTPTDPGLYIPDTARGLALCVLYAAVIPGIFEELTFRGLVLGAWERRGRLRALLVSSLLFASLHGSVAGFPVHLLLGVVLGLLALGSESIYAGMIFHTLYNSLILLEQYAARHFPAATATEPAEEGDILAALGGPMELLPVLRSALIFGGLLALVLRYVWRRGLRAGVTPVPAAKAAMTWQALLVLLSGVATVLYLYGTNLIDMLKGSL